MVRLMVLGFALVAVVPVLADSGNSGKSDRFRVKTPAKTVMLFFSADWCAPCRLLATQTFADEKVRRFLEERVTVVRVNIDQNPKLTERHKVLAIPTLLFLDPTGKEVGRILGSMPPAGFLREATRILK